MLLEVDRGRGIHVLSDFWMVSTQPTNLIPLPLLLYHAYKPRKSPKSGIWLSPISSISHHHDGEKRKIACQQSCFTILVSFPRHNPRTAAHTAGCPGAVSAPPAVPFPQPTSGGRSPTAPTRQQAVDYTKLLVSPSVPRQYQRRPSFPVRVVVA